MSLTIPDLDATQYAKLRYAFVKQVEESGAVSLSAYVDTKGIPTMGLGFNLQDDVRSVTSEA